MLRFLILLVLILNSAAKLYGSLKEFDEENDLHRENSDRVKFPGDFVNRGAPLWVLTLSGGEWLAPKLRLGNTAELEQFFHYIKPSLKNIGKRRAAARIREKKDDPERFTYPVHTSIREAKKDFTLMINKLVSSSSIEPDAYITDNNFDSYDNSPSIALHFKGPYSVMIVELNSKQWHFFINSRSSLPEWLYEKHDTRDSPILIPEDVVIQLFSSLWRLLHVFLGWSSVH